MGPGRLEPSGVHRKKGRNNTGTEVTQEGRVGVKVRVGSQYGGGGHGQGPGCFRSSVPQPTRDPKYSTMKP